MRGTLIVFVKQPVAGRVKTRLGREIGMGRAAALFRFMTQTTLAEAAKSCLKTVIAVDPDAALYWRGATWPSGMRRIAQGRGDLGRRLSAALKSAPPGPVAIIGADAPRLRASHLRAAFAALGRNDAVFGPAHDGGFWLVGLARRCRAPDAFRNVRWSSAHALADARASLPPDFTVARLTLLRDIDDASDLAAAGPLLRSKRSP